MRKTVFTLAALVGLSATTAIAGGMSEPVMEPQVVVQESTGSSGGIVVPLLLLAVVAAIAASN